MKEIPTHFNFARDVFEYWAGKRPDALALWWADERGSEKRFTFAEMAADLRRAAALFARQGIQGGDRVLIILPRVPQWWVAMLGLIRLGAVPIPGTPLLTQRDIEYRVGAADVSAIITDAAGAAKVAENDSPRIRIVVDADQNTPQGWVSFDREIVKESTSFDPPNTLSDAPGIIYFTSGTTGHPKMVLHTQSSYGMGHRITAEHWLDCRPGDVHWNLSDTGWAKAAWSSFYGPWHLGACVYAVDARGKFDPSTVLDVLENGPVTTWCAPPTALRLMVREELSRRRFPRLRHCVSAGEPLNPEVISLWQQATGLHIYEGYGQTESVCMIANQRTSGEAIQPGSMGRPMSGFELDVLDPDMRPVADDQEGQLAVRVHPHRPLGLFKEYWRNPNENAARFVGDHYLTGDVVRRSGDGCFWFVGRADDVIKSSGYRIGPFEVESALVEHPDVLEAAVVAKLDQIRGQIVKAFVVLRRDVKACEDLKNRLQDHCRRVTAPYKYPREIEFVPDLPKTVSGKIRRVELRSRG